MSQQFAAGEHTGSKGVIDNLNDAIRDNPLAAGLIGAGVVWALFGRANAPGLGGIANALKSTASTVGSAVADSGAAMAAEAAKAGNNIADAASRVTDAASGAIHSVTPRDFSVVSDAGDTIMAGVRSSAEAGKRYGASAQKVLSENLERQPLLLGAIGLAVGAGIASAFPSTHFEDELMGASGTAARKSLQALAEQTKELAATRATEVFEAVTDEAKTQGLTPAAAGDAFKDVSQKVKGVVGSARQAVTSRVS